MFLLLACTPPVDTATAVDSVVETTETGDTLDTAENGPWPDPINRVESLALNTQGMELTDALMAGDIVVLSGQQQQGKGGIWTWDPETGDNDKLDLWTVQDVCWDGQRIWGVNRNSTLYLMALDGEQLELMNSWSIGGLDGGVSCDSDHIAYGRGQRGAFVHTKEANWTLSGPTHLDVPTTGVLVDGDTLWTTGQDTLLRWSLPELELQDTLTLEGTCRQLDGTAERLVVACGAGGVFLVEEGGVTQHWKGHASARHAVLWDGGVLVAAWTELIALDSELGWIGSEHTRSATMAVTAHGDTVYAAEWSSPWTGTVPGGPSPEARVSPATVARGSNTQIFNDGTRRLTLSDGRVVLPGERVTWELPDQDGDQFLGSDDPDESNLSVTIGGNGLGDPAPDFIEQDTDGKTWELQALRGEVVWLGLFQDG